MRIVNFHEFCGLPDGTVFSYWEPCIVSGLYRRGSVISGRGKPYGNGPSESSFMQKTAATLPDTFYGLPTFLKQSQTTDDILDRIANARAQTATEVSDGNAAAGNYRKGRFNYHGLRISIENPKGSVRSGTAADGTRWSNTMKFDYGYIRGTMGADGDPVDVFIGDDPKSEMVYVINQVNKSGSFDEHKVVLWALDAKQAKQTYLSNYKDGWTGAGSVVGMTMQQFKQWLQSGDIKKPAGEVKQASGQELAAARLRALLIEGNPERPGDPERMHVSLQRLLDSLGYDVQRVSSADYTDVPDSDLAVGFSRGADRLRFSNAPLRIGIGSGRSMDGVQMVNHPRDRVNLANPDDFNTLPVATQRAHSTLTKGMKNKLTGLIAGGANTAVSTVKQAENHTAVAPCDNPVQVLINMADTTAWRQVPKQVAKLMKSASDDVGPIDFFEASLIAVSWNGEFPVCDLVESRWGMFDHDQLFLVYEPQDIAVIAYGLGIDRQ